MDLDNGKNNETTQSPFVSSSSTITSPWTVDNNTQSGSFLFSNLMKHESSTSNLNDKPNESNNTNSTSSGLFDFSKTSLFFGQNNSDSASSLNTSNKADQTQQNNLKSLQSGSLLNDTTKPSSLLNINVNSNPFAVLNERSSLKTHTSSSSLNLSNRSDQSSVNSKTNSLLAMAPSDTYINKSYSPDKNSSDNSTHSNADNNVFSNKTQASEPFVKFSNSSNFNNSTDENTNSNFNVPKSKPSQDAITVNLRELQHTSILDCLTQIAKQFESNVPAALQSEYQKRVENANKMINTQLNSNADFSKIFTKLMNFE